MSDAEICAFGFDIATAIRAHGQVLAGKARSRGNYSGARLFVDMFEEAAKIAELRMHLRRIDLVQGKKP